MIVHPATRLVCLALALACVPGCGKDTATISGTVTYEGEEVEYGSISFAPVDGNGPSAGAEIHNGKYRADGVRPGKKKVFITGARDTTPTVKEGNITKRGRAAWEPLFPPNVTGNNQVVDVDKGKQEMNFDLT